MKNFAVVQEHFRKLRCAHCQQSFTPEGVKLLLPEEAGERFLYVIEKVGKTPKQYPRKPGEPHRKPLC